MALDDFLVQRWPMSLRLPQPVPPVPDDTARIARAAFPRGNHYLRLRDRLGPVFDDAGFADLYARRGQAGYTPWRLAVATLLQFREGLSNCQAAEAVRARIDWKYLLARDLANPGFDHTVLCEFRSRLLQHAASERLLTRVLDAAREGPVTAKVCVLAKALRDTRFVKSAAPDPQQNQALRPSSPRAPGGEVSRDPIDVRSTVRP